MWTKGLWFIIGGICFASVGILMLLFFPSRPSIRYIVIINNPPDVISDELAVDIGKRVLSVHAGTTNWKPLREEGVGKRLFISERHTPSHGWVAFTNGHEDRIVIMSVENGAVVGKVLGPKNRRLGWKIANE